jgi:DNA (cytosine-5)-methyltransferase 1
VKVLDLFSGIGGFSLGLERAGMETVAFCEISPVCRHLLAHHWPNVPCFDDVTTLTGEQVGPVDVICGGFPCQDISFAGKGAGLAGERSGLWREYARLVRELRPAFVIVENVAALLGRGLGDVLGDLASLGYDAWWDCIPASAVGAPHRRDRLWIVAYARGQQHEGFGDALRREIAAELSRAAAEQGVCAGHGGEAFALDPHADGLRPYRSGMHVVGSPELRDEQVGDAKPLGFDVADADCKLRHRRRSGAEQNRRDQSPDRCHVGHADCAGLPIAGIPGGQSEATGGVEARGAADRAGWWAAEPDVGRVAHGVPARVDRLHGLGNAVVPKIPKIIGRAIMSAAAQHQDQAA